MSDTVETQSKTTSRDGGTADKRALAQVEKWMAVIREINGDRLKLRD
jgi:hypothetical protein